MDKKLLIKRIAGIAAFILLLVLAVNKVYNVVSWKDTEGNYMSTLQELYATPKDTMEVVFVGSSHCYGGMDPNYLWTEFGIPAFDMCCSGQDKDSAYHELVELLKTQSPKVVVVEDYALLFEEQENIGNAYRNMLSMRLSKNANDLIRDYVKEEEQQDYLLRWPIVHTRYQELTKYDFYQYEPSIYGRGFNFTPAITPVALDPYGPQNTEIEPLSDHNKAWLDELIELSQKENFELVFLNVTSDVSGEEQAIINGAKQYLEVFGIPFLDLNLCINEMGISQELDFIDANHLNYTGAQKATAYVATFLMENYDLEAKDGQEGYEYWDQNAEYMYHRIWTDKLGRTDRGEYLDMILSQKDVITVLSLDGYFGITGSDWGEVLGKYNLHATPEDIMNGGTWVIRGGKLMTYMPNGTDGEIWAMDINDVDTLVIKNVCDDGVPRTEIKINAETRCQNTDGLNVFVYDELMADVVNTRHYD